MSNSHEEKYALHDDAFPEAGDSSHQIFQIEQGKFCQRM
jgi:hypothetical protein